MDNLFAAGSLNLNRRGDIPTVNSGNGGGAGSRARRLSLSRSTFEDAEFYSVTSEHLHQLHVGSVREFATVANRLCASLPFVGKVFDELNKMRIPSRDDESFRISAGNRNGF